MKKLLARLFGPTASAVSAQETQWPPLPDSGFLSGRAAEQQDVDAGNAVFVAAVGGVSIGEPISIQIPQYAFHVEQDRKTPVIIIQAESAQGQQIVGARNFDGSEIAATLSEFELLGPDLPN